MDGWPIKISAMESRQCSWMFCTLASVVIERRDLLKTEKCLYFPLSYYYCIYKHKNYLLPITVAPNYFGFMIYTLTTEVSLIKLIISSEQ